MATLTNSDFHDYTTWRMQMGFLHEHIKERRLLTMRDVAALFECRPGSVLKQLTAIDKCGGRETIKMGRSSLLTPDADAMTECTRRMWGYTAFSRGAT
jgi:hypothetical protein